MRIGIVVPHIFMHRDILPNVIFSPGTLALSLAEGLQTLGASITLFTPGPVSTEVQNITADLSYFEAELKKRGDNYIDLLKKHPFTFITLARQVQSELITKAYDRANAGDFDVIHVYTNEEDIALPFSKLCKKPVVFTHHDPFNFLVKYTSVFPKYKDLNWLSISFAQRAGMPQNTHWVGNIYHGLGNDLFKPASRPAKNYIAYLGRIIEPKGLHLAIAAVKAYNDKNPTNPYELRIAGKHYSGSNKDTYWNETIRPQIDNKVIKYLGFIGNTQEKELFLANAAALIIPSTWEEPFGMVTIESLACGTPVIGLNSGAIPETIIDNKTGILVKKFAHDNDTVVGLTEALRRISLLNRKECRKDFEARFTLARMCQEHLTVYDRLIEANL